MIERLEKHYKNDIYFKISADVVNKTLKLYFGFYIDEGDNWQKEYTFDKRNFSYNTNIVIKRLTKKKEAKIKEFLNKNKNELFDFYQKCYETEIIDISKLDEISNELKNFIK